MKTFTLAALLAAFILPITASAQVSQQPYQGQQAKMTNPGKHAYHRWMKRLAGVNLSGQQQQQVQGILGQYAAQHPAGSPRDKGAARALRDQIFSVLSPQQQGQLRAQAAAMREQHMQQQQQRQGQPIQVQQAPPAR